MTDYSKIRIALDGPSGAGKSTIAKGVAAKLKLIYVDTGALYRSIALFMTENGIDGHDTDRVISSLEKINLEITYIDGAQEVLLNGSPVGLKIRTPEISAMASLVSKIPEVRTFLLDVQRNIASKGGVIMDGRDIGTVIIPDAELKVFMTATPEARAKRRCLELEEKGMPQSYEEVLADIIARDKQDSERAAAPLKPASDAVMFVNDDYGIEECIDHIISLIK